jgi:hypothetical protein
MNLKLILNKVKGISILFATAVAIMFTSCSKHSDNSPHPSPTPTISKTDSALLIQNGNTTWTATAGTYYTGKNATGTATPATQADLGADGSFALGAVTFTADSLILSFYSYNGFGIIKWNVTNTKPAQLSVNFGTYIDGTANGVEGVQVLNAQIVSLNKSQLVIIVNSTFIGDYQSYEETLSASSGIVTYALPSHRALSRIKSQITK